MKAIVYTEYGAAQDVLRLAEVQKPAPKDEEVLLKIHAAALNAADWHIMKGDPFLVRLMVGGLLKPNINIPGPDVAGRVEAIGKNVTRFQVRDAVFGDISASGCGACAEYVCAKEQELALKPANLSFAEAAAVPLAGVSALQGLRDAGKIHAGQKVLIHGASGGVGTFAVQIAKSFGAQVTAVCSPSKVEMLRSLGADDVIDYTRSDFSQNGQRYDLILAANGNRSLADYKRALAPQGIYVMVGGSMSQMISALLLGPLYSRNGGQKFTALSAKSSAKDLAFLKELLEAGKIKPVLDKRFPLSQAQEAFHYLEEGHAKGKIIVSLQENEQGNFGSGA